MTGTMSPSSSTAEVFVTDDGAEKTSISGPLERFRRSLARPRKHVNAGQIYQAVVQKERRGAYLGPDTCRSSRHVTDDIKSRIRGRRRPRGRENVDVVIVAIGGTVGDIRIACVPRKAIPPELRID